MRDIHIYYDKYYYLARRYIRKFIKRRRLPYFNVIIVEDCGYDKNLLRVDVMSDNLRIYCCTELYDMLAGSHYSSIKDDGYFFHNKKRDFVKNGYNMLSIKDMGSANRQGTSYVYRMHELILYKNYEALVDHFPQYRYSGSAFLVYGKTAYTEIPGVKSFDDLVKRINDPDFISNVKTDRIREEAISKIRKISSIDNKRIKLEKELEELKGKLSDEDRLKLEIGELNGTYDNDDDD